MNLSGAVLLGKPAEQVAAERKHQQTLIRVGGKLAVLGVDPAAPFGKWHVLQPGSFDAPQGLSGQPDQQGTDLTYGRSMCGMTVVSNGYASDHTPPRGQLCPACAERV